KRYYDKMMTGPDRRVDSIHADPQVAGRHVYGDWAVSWGSMNDEFLMTDGAKLRLDSCFTAVVARRGAEWKVVGFHLSTNPFDNPILSYAVKRTALVFAASAGVAALVVGFGAGWLVRRRKRAGA